MQADTCGENATLLKTEKKLVNYTVIAYVDLKYDRE
jgi:hypothetical protein